MTTLLKVTDLKVSYGAISALKGISLEVGQGEMVALIGSNGAGKTTLCRALSGLIARQAGTIEFEGDALPTVAHEVVKRGLVQVPEGRMIFGNMTVKENLELGSYLRQDKKEILRDLEEVLTLFPRLSERFKQAGATLSGGEQQMLAIGRALMAKPRCLILDEPSLGLAPNLVQQIFTSFKAIHARGVSLLLIEQDAQLALKTTSRAYVMESGLITLCGPSAELITNPQVRDSYLGG